MTPESRKYLKELLLKHEGFRQFPYRDITGHLTVGIGRNLDAKGISLDEALVLLDNDVQRDEHALWRVCPVFNKLNDARKIALLNMCYNLGIDGLMKFRKMFAYLEAEDYANAAKEALDSLWAKQVGNRAHDIAYLIEEGVIDGHYS